MAVPLVRKQFTPADYYALEHDATYKSDFYEGEIFDMSGGSPRHSLICANVVSELHQRLKGGPCTAYESNLRLMCKASGLRTYPDASVYCAELAFDDEDRQRHTVTNPTVLFEVLSPSTREYDEGIKRHSYWRIDSLKLYVMIRQDRPLAEIHSRAPSGGWTIAKVRGLEAVIPLSALSIELPLKDVYSGVDFDD